MYQLTCIQPVDIVGKFVTLRYRRFCYIWSIMNTQNVVDLNTELQTKLRAFRERHGYSQREMADLLGVTERTIRRWESEAEPLQFALGLLLILAFCWLDGASEDKENLEVHGMTGSELRQAREELNLSQSQLADRLGVSRATVNRWENGATDITSRTLIGMAIEQLKVELEKEKTDGVAA
jgi:transcriptional regulator with XRE-family HTH domain